jgi:hypothetical protein
MIIHAQNSLMNKVYYYVFTTYYHISYHVSDVQDRIPSVQKGKPKAIEFPITETLASSGLIITSIQEENEPSTRLNTHPLSNKLGSSHITRSQLRQSKDSPSSITSNVQTTGTYSHIKRVHLKTWGEWATTLCGKYKSWIHYFTYSICYLDQLCAAPMLTVHNYLMLLLEYSHNILLPCYSNVICTTPVQLQCSPYNFNATLCKLQ